MIDYSNISIKRISIHQIGNKANGGKLMISDAPLSGLSEEDESRFIQNFIIPFKDKHEFFEFTHTSDLQLHELNKYSSSIFGDIRQFHKRSQDIAKHLFEQSIHPNTSEGQLSVLFFQGVGLNDKEVSMLGLFKTEANDVFLKAGVTRGNARYTFEEGTLLANLNKGALLFNSEDGIKVLILDKSSGSEAQYWRERFLMVKPCSDNYHYTKDILQITKEFVTKQLPQEFAVTKVDQAEILQRSASFFKEKETYDEREFADLIFGDKAVINSFSAFKDEFLTDQDIEIAENFSISKEAVKRQSRAFKSVIKLDKNFHVYIHGNQAYIEKGFDPVFKKHFYKLYFDQEA